MGPVKAVIRVASLRAEDKRFRGNASANAARSDSAASADRACGRRPSTGTCPEGPMSALVVGMRISDQRDAEHGMARRRSASIDKSV